MCRIEWCLPVDHMAIQCRCNTAPQPKSTLFGNNALGSGIQSTILWLRCKNTENIQLFFVLLDCCCCCCCILLGIASNTTGNLITWAFASADANFSPCICSRVLAKSRGYVAKVRFSNQNQFQWIESMLMWGERKGKRMNALIRTQFGYIGWDHRYYVCAPECVGHMIFNGAQLVPLLDGRHRWHLKWNWSKIRAFH